MKSENKPYNIRRLLWVVGGLIAIGIGSIAVVRVRESIALRAREQKAIDDFLALETQKKKAKEEELEKQLADMKEMDAANARSVEEISNKVAAEYETIASDIEKDSINCQKAIQNISSLINGRVRDGDTIPSFKDGTPTRAGQEADRLMIEIQNFQTKARALKEKMFADLESDDGEYGSLASQNSLLAKLRDRVDAAIGPMLAVEFTEKKPRPSSFVMRALNKTRVSLNEYESDSTFKILVDTLALQYQMLNRANLDMPSPQLAAMERDINEKIRIYQRTRAVMGS